MQLIGYCRLLRQGTETFWENGSVLSGQVALKQDNTALHIILEDQ